MDTNLITICNILAQPGGRTSGPNNPKAQETAKNADCAVDDHPVPQNESQTDNNPAKDTNKSDGKDKLKFQDTLRKKINPKNPDNVDDAGKQKEKTSDAAKPPATLHVIFTPVDVIPAHSPKDDGIVRATTDLNSEFPGFAPPLQPVPAYFTEIVSNGQETPAILSETPNETLPVALLIAPAVNIEPNEPGQITVEGKQTVAEFIPKIAQDENVPSANTFTGDETSFVSEYPSKSKTINPPQIHNKTPFLVSPKADNPLPDRAFPGIKENVLRPDGQLNVPLAQENQPQQPLSNQKSNSQTDETLPAQSSIHTKNVSAEQINTLNTQKLKNLKNLSETENFHTKEKSDNQVSPDTTHPSAITEQPTFAAAPSKTTGVSHSALGLGRQIQESVSSFYRPGTQQIVIRLDPPDLGRVTIKFIEHRDGNITGILHVDKSQTKDQIQQLLPGIAQNLQNSDIPIKKLEVVLNNQQNYNASGDQSGGQHDTAGRKNSHSTHELENPASYKDWLTHLNNSHEVTDSRIQWSNNAINMLI